MSSDTRSSNDSAVKGSKVEGDAEASAALHEDLTFGSDNKLTRRLLRFGVEPRGFLLGQPDLSYLRDSCLVILFFSLLCCIPPAYLTTWGPKLGMRQMCQSRYSFGYYGAIVPAFLNAVTGGGFLILNCILGGQTLAAVSSGGLSWTVGIVIIAVISLLISFCGYKVLHWYERVAWIPVLITYIIAIGIGGKHLSNPPASVPATAGAVLSFGAIVAGFTLPFSPLSADYTTYMDSRVSSLRMFLWAYFGLLIPLVVFEVLGAAFAISSTVVPSWTDGYNENSVGGLFNAVLAPVGGFGKFLTVLLSLSVTANNAPTMYSFGLSFQVMFPFTARIPRYVFAVIATAIAIPLSIVGAHRFYDALVNFLSIIAYWVSVWLAVILSEHFIFRRGSYAMYDIARWNSSSLLPSGIPALAACVLSFGLIVPCMDQVWFVGPIAQNTGDIGFEVGFMCAIILYILFRTLEIRMFPNKSGI